MLFNINIEGQQGLFKKVNPLKMIKGVEKGIVKVLLFLESKAVPETPIRSGHLRKGYNSEQRGFTGKLYNNTEYAGFVHNGTKNQKANPFLKRVLDKNGRRATDLMNRTIISTLKNL